jgi:hypothetical protein
MVVVMQRGLEYQHVKATVLRQAARRQPWPAGPEPAGGAAGNCCRDFAAPSSQGVTGRRYMQNLAETCATSPLRSFSSANSFWEALCALAFDPVNRLLHREGVNKMSVTGEIDISKLNTQQLEQYHKQTETVRASSGTGKPRSLASESSTLSRVFFYPSAGNQEPECVSPAAADRTGEVSRIFEFAECDTGRRGG